MCTNEETNHTHKKHKHRHNYSYLVKLHDLSGLQLFLCGQHNSETVEWRAGLVQQHVQLAVRVLQ